MGHFSITGQPNAMGGREVGGLANQLAAHMDFAPTDIDRVGRFWRAASMAQTPGLKAVDMVRAVEDGRIKALWIMATNPAVSMPDANRVRAALTHCDFLVCSDLFADGRFYTPSGKARLVPIQVRPPATAPDDDYPLALNTGRIRDQWHTMTRTGLAPRLASHIAEPYLQIHPVDAATQGLTNGALAALTSRWGRMLARVHVDQDQRPDAVFVPMHWSDALARTACADALVNPLLDPISGQPEFKHTPVRVRPFRAAWYGFAVSRERIELPDPEWCVAVRGDGHWRLEIAGTEQVPDWAAWARWHFGVDGDWLDFADPTHGRYRGARIEGGRLRACLFISPAPDLPRSSWLAGLFQRDQLDAAARTSLLAGRPPRGQSDPGETVCACFNVGLNTLVAGIREADLASAEAIGAALQAGTNCGSCIPELNRILAAERRAA